MNDLNSPSTNFYLVITSMTQLPDIPLTLSPYPWKPCAIQVIFDNPYPILNKDPYLSRYISYFLTKNIICSDEICQNINYCNPLWFVLMGSNKMKRKHNFSYINQYLHPISEFSMEKHEHQHLLKTFGQL
jgi:hypothetical protein